MQTCASHKCFEHAHSCSSTAASPQSANHPNSPNSPLDIHKMRGLMQILMGGSKPPAKPPANTRSRSRQLRAILYNGPDATQIGISVVPTFQERLRDPMPIAPLACSWERNGSPSPLLHFGPHLRGLLLGLVLGSLPQPQPPPELGIQTCNSRAGDPIPLLPEKGPKTAKCNFRRGTRKSHV